MVLGVPQKFFCEYKHLSLIILALMAKATWKYFYENFDSAETVNI